MGLVMRLYHGSPFAGLDATFSNFTSRQPAVFFSEERRVADEYALSNTGLASGARPPHGVTDRPTVYICDVDPGNIFDMRKPDHRAIYAELRRTVGKVGEDDDEDARWPAPRPGNGYFDARGLPVYSLARVLKKPLTSMGFDSIWVDEGSQGKSLGLFDVRGRVHVVAEERAVRMNPRRGHLRRAVDDAGAGADQLKSVLLELLAEAPRGAFTAEIRLVVDDRTALAGRDPDGRAQAATDGHTIFVAEKLLHASRARQTGVLAHELAHVYLIQHGIEEHTERAADDTARDLFGITIRYDNDDVQTSSSAGVAPRPARLDARANPGGAAHAGCIPNPDLSRYPTVEELLERCDGGDPFYHPDRDLVLSAFSVEEISAFLDYCAEAYSHHPRGFLSDCFWERNAPLTRFMILLSMHNGIINIRAGRREMVFKERHSPYEVYVGEAADDMIATGLWGPVDTGRRDANGLAVITRVVWRGTPPWDFGVKSEPLENSSRRYRRR